MIAKAVIKHMVKGGQIRLLRNLAHRPPRAHRVAFPSRKGRHNDYSPSTRWALTGVGVLAALGGAWYQLKDAPVAVPPRLIQACVVACDSDDSFTDADDSDQEVEEETSFEVLSALDMREECQKVRLAQILHDLHEIAKHANGDVKVKKHSTVRRMWKFVRGSTSTTTSDDNKESLASKRSGDGLHKDRAAFEKMTPAKAHDLIQELEHGAKLDAETVLHLLGAATQALLKEETMIDLRPQGFERVTVVGDLHGSVQSLQHVLTVVGEDSIAHADHAIVFDGDFVDRGENSLGVFLILLLLKLAYPHTVYLLRGNHEDVLVASAYGFQDELVGKYGAEEAEDIWEVINEAFCALPLCIQTDTAVILHGGLPSENFKLAHLSRISAEERSRMTSVMEPQDKNEEIVQGILWSDPSKRNGMRHNEVRSVGTFFGLDVAEDFLERHSAKYLVRGHQSVSKGAQIMDCGGGRSVVTVFSQPNYPNGSGTNLGAFVHLTSDGDLEVVKFSRETELVTDAACNEDEAHYMNALKDLIAKHRAKLEQTFESEAPGGTVSASHWASIMSRTLRLPQVPWMVLSLDLTPESADPNCLDWRGFLNLYSSRIQLPDNVSEQHSVSMEALHANQDMIMTTFKFLDRDGKGNISKEDFTAGIKLLNRRLTKGKALNDTDALFDQIDHNGNGKIGIADLGDIFKHM